jgi:hypothetical protein
VPVLLLVAAAATLAGVIAVALGRGGEMARFSADFVPFDIDDVTATDVALLRPPSALWGYHMQATDDALGRIARTMTERDVEIATLRQQLAEARRAAETGAARPGPPRMSGPPGPPGTAAAGPALASPPGGPRREAAGREAADPDPASSPWPARAPWSAWERSAAQPAPAPDPDAPGGSW